MIRSLGAVPIPTAPAQQPTATASEQRPTVLDMGAPVRASLPGGTTAVVTALGPRELTSAPDTPSTIGVFTVRLDVVTGTVRAHAADFSSRNETGRAVSLRPSGPTSVTARPGHPVQLTIRGRYASGAAQLTWRHDGKVVAVWDFNIELD